MEEEMRCLWFLHHQHLPLEQRDLPAGACLKFIERSGQDPFWELDWPQRTGLGQGDSHQSTCWQLWLLAPGWPGPTWSPAWAVSPSTAPRPDMLHGNIHDWLLQCGLPGAGEVTVTTEHDTNEQWCLGVVSNGSFTKRANTGEQMGHGTKVILHLKRDQMKYLEKRRIKGICRSTCNSLSTPSHTSLWRSGETRRWMMIKQKRRMKRRKRRCLRANLRLKLLASMRKRGGAKEGWRQEEEEKDQGKVHWQKGTRQDQAYLCQKSW